MLFAAAAGFGWLLARALEDSLTYFAPEPWTADWVLSTSNQW